MTPATLTATWVLQLDDIFQRAVEAAGPEMRAGQGIDQLPGDAHLRSGFAHRANAWLRDSEPEWSDPFMSFINRLRIRKSAAGVLASAAARVAS
jgi:hypothetical protein